MQTIQQENKHRVPQA